MALSDSQDDEELPVQLGQWRRGEPIGAGGAGRVFLAEHMESGERGALKIAHASLRSVQRHWFRREAALAARLRHPAIVPLLDSGDFGGRPFLVYEYVPGPTLHSVADELSLEAIVNVGRALFDALTYAHDAGVVHCDISPSNILLAEQTARLIDFGLAKARNERSPDGALGTVSGTPGYLSPEQARGSALLGPASDLFGCGAVLFRLLAGYAPYADVKTTSTLSMQPKMHFGNRYGELESSQLAEVVLKLLAEDPERRFPSAALAGRAWSAAANETAFTSHVPASRPTHQPLITVHTALAATDTVDAASESALVLPTQTRVPLVGRDALVERVSAELKEAAAKRYVVVHGAPGTGRTRLAEEVLARFARTVRIEGRRDMAGPPLEGLAAIAARLAGAPAEEPVWRAAERLHSSIYALGLEDGSSGEDALIGGLLGAGPSRDARTAVMGALEVVQQLIGGEPTILFVDDAEGVDELTFQVLDSLLQTDAPVALLLVRASPLEGACNVPLTELEGEARARVWNAFGGFGDAPTGSLWDLRAQALVAEFDELPNAATEVLSAIAAFSSDVPLRAPVEIDETFNIEPLLRSGLVEPVRWSCAHHERWMRIPSAQLHAWADARLRPDADLRLSALRWLSRCSRDAPASNLPRVAVLAERLAMPDTASFAWAEAGMLAQRAQRGSKAAAYLERALAQPSVESIDRPRVLAELAAAYGDQGNPNAEARFAQFGSEAVELERSVLRARLLRLQARAAFDQGDNGNALALLRRAVDLIGAEGDPMESASCHASLGWLLGYRLGRNEEGIELGRQAMRIASRITAPAFQASLCGRLGANYLRAGDWDGQLRVNWQDLELSTEGSDIYGQVRANINLGVCFTNRGALATARTHTEHAYALAVRHGARGAAVVAANNLAMIAVHDGRIEDAERWTSAVASLCGETPLPCETELSRARIALSRGAVAEAREALRAARAQGDPGDAEHIARIAAMIEVGAGSLDAAIA
ncbi:MAG: protein kinase, partial [Myxococcota bacterium]